MNNIHFPIALEKGTNRLVNVKDVENGLACNCYCASCKEDLIAVNKEVIQKAHFRHIKESNCPFNKSYETYIHWLAKAVIKNLDAIVLPPVTFSDLNIDRKLHQKTTSKLENYLNEQGLLDEFNDHQLNFYSILFQPSTEIVIDACEIEKTYKTKIGDIRVDAVLNSNQQELFIEPYFTNQVDGNKLKRISTIGVSTISIDLLAFAKHNTHYFSKEVFTDYIRNNVDGKKWVFIRESKAKKLIDNIFNSTFHENLLQLKEKNDKNKYIKDKLEEINTERQELSAEFQRNLTKLNIESEALSNKLTTLSINTLFKKNDF